MRHSRASTAAAGVAAITRAASLARTFGPRSNRDPPDSARGSVARADDFAAGLGAASFARLPPRERRSLGKRSAPCQTTPHAR